MGKGDINVSLFLFHMNNLSPEPDHSQIHPKDGNG